MFDHARQDAPIEACGYLAQSDGVVSRRFAMTNVDNHTDHFSLDPKEQFAVVKAVREQGLQLAAVYHSHPVTPPRPSEEDIRLAFDPSISYVIVSLADGRQTVKSFKIRQGVVEPEEVEIVS